MSKPREGLLRPGEIPDVLILATEAVVDAGDYDAGVQRLLGTLVPRMADLAAVYGMGEDGRLHPRAVTRDRGDLEGGVGAERILSEDDEHPAARAAREGRAVLLYRSGSPRIAGVADAEGRGFDGRPVQGLALPLRARGEVGGVLYLVLSDGGRAYGPPDLEVSRGLAERLALVLDNRRLLREARDARRAKVDFLSVMSHELRTPLTAVVGYADLMETGIPGPVNEEQGVQLQRIKESAWQLLELIDGILGYARFDGEEPEVLRERVTAAAVVDEAMDVVRSTLEAKGLRLEVDVPSGLPPLWTDRAKLHQILVHLLDNAVKFTSAGTVLLRVRRKDDGVHFAVEDTGPGIRHEDRERIFEPFWQGQRAETRTAGGTGMGLSLADRLARLLDGEIRLEERPGPGSTFVLVLPDRRPEDG